MRPKGRSRSRSPELRRPSAARGRALPKCPTGIRGFDDITGGGLPRGRPTLVTGGPGSGKTMFAVEFIARGILDYGEPGAFVSFEERPEDLVRDSAVLGLDLGRLAEQGKLALEHVSLESADATMSGAYDLEALFIRLDQAIRSVRAKRVVLDTIENLFVGLPGSAILRVELRRLFYWLKERGVTSVVTGERSDGDLTRHGLEEYVSDCVIALDNRVLNQISTRRVRIVKYRGSRHGTNEYPFLIDEDGISVLPITSLGLRHRASTERVSTGIPRLDDMLGGGYFRGSTILVSGTAGSGKTSLAAHFARASCRQGGRCLYFAFEESPDQIRRNMRSIGIDIAGCQARGALRIEADRPTIYGLEMHLAMLHKRVEEFRPTAVIIDPLTSLLPIGSALDVRAMLTRLIDFLKTRAVTALFTSLSEGGEGERTEVGVSSLIDTWMVLRDLESGGERRRSLYIVKSRGTAHSRQVREFHLTSSGLQLHGLPSEGRTPAQERSR